MAVDQCYITIPHKTQVLPDIRLGFFRFRADSKSMKTSVRPAMGTGNGAAAILTKAEARDLTDRIDMSQDTHWGLLYEAKVKRAWIPLGYATFGDYVAHELNMKRSQAYNLLKAYAIKNEIILNLPLGMEMPDVGSTVLLGVTKEQACEIAKEMTRRKKATGSLDSAAAKQVIKEKSAQNREKGKPDLIFNEEAMNRVTAFGGSDLPPYFQILWDAVAVLEGSTSERDLYRGFDALVNAYDRIHALLERLEDGAEGFLEANPDFNTTN